MFTPIYNITDCMLGRLSEIAEIKNLVQSAKLLPARQAMLRRAAFIKMTHSSTSIEGNTLAEYQVQALSEGKKVHAEKDQIIEAKNYMRALGHIDTLANMSHFTAQDMITVQKIVTDQLIESKKSGTFRAGPVYVVNILPNGKEQRVYTPPRYTTIPHLINNLLIWLQESIQIHPVIRAGLFHYQFESIHPFADGNGRTGRLLTLLHLYQSGWDFKRVLVLEDYYNQNRKQYYEALQTALTYEKRKEADLTGWLEYFIKGFWEETIKVKERIRMLQVGRRTATGQRLDTDELKIVDFLLTVGRITSSDVVNILNIPKRTAQSKLKRLEDIQVLEKKDAGPATYYVIAAT